MMGNGRRTITTMAKLNAFDNNPYKADLIGICAHIAGVLVAVMLVFTVIILLVGIVSSTAVALMSGKGIRDVPCIMWYGTERCK